MNKFKDECFLYGLIGISLFTFFIIYEFHFLGVLGGVGIMFLYLGLYNRLRIIELEVEKKKWKGNK